MLLSYEARRPSMVSGESSVPFVLREVADEGLKTSLRLIEWAYHLGVSHRMTCLYPLGGCCLEGRKLVPSILILYSWLDNYNTRCAVTMLLDCVIGMKLCHICFGVGLSNLVNCERLSRRNAVPRWWILFVVLV